MKFMELETKNPIFPHKQLSTELVWSDSTIKR